MSRRMSISSRQEAEMFLGQPIYALDQKGNVYVGVIAGVEEDAVRISGAKYVEVKEQAQVQGMLGSLFSGMLGAGGAGGAATGGGSPLPNLFNGLGNGKRGMFRLGFGALQMLMPLVGRFFL
ncbi:hypothetical protein [Marinicrinis sediminis]|uniref:Uncharacterized protein n=1 Tax=Marinicrinis sediminis TaxID=1652465 RepID=A0ABW5R6F8_9BACL